MMYHHSIPSYSPMQYPANPFVQPHVHQASTTNYRTHPNQQNYWQNYYQYYNPFAQRPYPEVDPTMFTESAHEMQELMREASLVLDRLAESKDFAISVMSAAQESDTKKVDELLKTTGIHSSVDVTYNPDGINLKLTGDKNCCNLTIALRWRG
ncbi:MULTISPECIES: hypothetical protein [Bacillus]|uniref:hypothetical protein n=1 Tax=Bacillus TaxID=1386 RepID=UPI001143D6E5|nr:MULTISPECIES: hypothetical protein [Bacillus]